MLQNLNHYENMLSRAHSNYLAQISIEITQLSNTTNDVLNRMTVFATILLPMNVVTGIYILYFIYIYFFFNKIQIKQIYFFSSYNK